MPLRITNSTTDIALINRWAEDIEARLNATTKQAGHALTTIKNTPPVVIPPGVTDGLIHGDAIWESDTAYTLVRDDFLGGGTASLAVGQHGWALFANNTGNVFAPRGSAYGFPASGAIKICNSAVAAGFANINLSQGAGNGNSWMPLFDYPSWKATFVFGLTVGDGNPASSKFTKKALYVGLAANNIDNAWPARPRIFCGLRYDTDTTAPSIGDTTFKYEVVTNLTNTANTTRTNVQGTVIDTGVTPAMGLYRLEIQCITAGVVTMSLNGSTPVTFSIPTITCGTGVDNGTGSLTDNVGVYSPGNPGTVFQVNSFTSGSKVTLAGLTGTPDISFFNGVQTLVDVLQSSQDIKFILTHANVATSNSTGTVTGFPGVVPFFSFGNDTQAAPTANSLAILIDFCSLIWNPAVGGGTGSALITKPRYW